LADNACAARLCLHAFEALARHAAIAVHFRILHSSLKSWHSPFDAVTSPPLFIASLSAPVTTFSTLIFSLMPSLIFFPAERLHTTPHAMPFMPADV
jgi:hypothetical protein